MDPIIDRGRTFSLDISSDGAASLKKAILSKLSEFMGDYTDDILAQYILVLVAHGKHQAQAAKDLEAFLGDQSEAFVSWLWDYLCSNLHLVTSVPKRPTTEPNGKEILKGTSADIQDSFLTNDPREGPSKDSKLIPKSTKENREHKSGSLEKDRLGADERHGGHHSAKRPRSPHHSRAHNERKASDMEHHHKRHLSPPRVNATRRLLQFAVRDAVAPVASLLKSGSKRLCSVVSTDIEHSETLEVPSRHLSFQDPLEIDDIRQAIKTVSPTFEESVSLEDASKSRPHMVGSVWNRLGKIAEDGKGQVLEQRRNLYASREVEDSRFVDGNTDERVRQKTGSGSPEKVSASVFSRMTEYKDARTGARQHPAYQLDNARVHKDVPIMKEKDVVHKGHEETPKTCLQKASDLSKHGSDSKVQASRVSEPSSFHTQAPTEQGNANNDLKGIHELKDRLYRVQLEMTKLRAKQSQVKTDSQKTSPLPPEIKSFKSPSGTEQVQKANQELNRPTIFVTNIHFAATKESVMTHFAQCGEIEDVIMLMDSVTGQPKGGAYIQFRTASAAEKAMAMNETSFYSRILKVVRSESAEIQEAPPLSTNVIRHTNLSMRGSTKSKILRGTSYTSPRIPTVPRRLVNSQWRRESTATSNGNPPVHGNKQGHVSQALTLNTSRSFSYIRNVSPCIEGTTEKPVANVPKGEVNAVKAT